MQRGDELKKKINAVLFQTSEDIYKRNKIYKSINDPTFTADVCEQNILSLRVKTP